MDYDDPIPDVIPLTAPLTRDTARRLAEEGVSGLKPDPSIPPDALAHLAYISTLRRLDLSGRDDLTDSDLAFLEAMPWLTAVSLARCGAISDGAVAHLRGHHALEQINLQWTRTGDASVAALAGKPNLSRVVLGNQLTDAGVSRLRDFPALAARGADGAASSDSFLSVSSARTLTDDALASIGGLTGVAALDLHMSVFGSPHYTARGVAHLRGMTSLEELNFHGQLATDDVLREIAGIPRLRHLHCQDIVSADEGFIALGKCDTLERFAARFCSRVTDRGYAAIAKLPRLRSLGLGGSRLTDDALAPLTESSSLVDLAPMLFGDDAFAYIARMPRLEKLTNMYNRSTTDAATRHLRNHPGLANYSAFGTQITDESLRVLADLPCLETLDLENCQGVTDGGLRALARSARLRLRRVSVWSCVGVDGSWMDTVRAARPDVEVKSEAGPHGHAAGYRFETLMDYPDMPIPTDAVAPRVPRGEAPASGLLSTLVCFAGESEFVQDGVRLALEPGVRDTRWMGLITPDAFSVPLRLDIIVDPITELRLVFGRHNARLTFDAYGSPDDDMPWFMKTAAQRGQSHRDDGDGAGATDDARVPLSGWVRITVEIEARERRLFVNGALRHTWRGDFEGVRSRVGIGVRRSAIAVRQLSVESLDAS